MECPYCNAEMIYEGPYGRGNMAAQEKYGYGWQKTGDMYRCPNHDGFDTEEEVREYYQLREEEELGESWDEVCCDSTMHNVGGCFYTDSNDNLKEGYPC